MKKNNLNQSGASAIMFAMVFIIVISLLTLGFATLARRDQRAALDKTLSNEAQYAAEAGVESVKEYVNRVGDAAVSNDQCDPSAVAAFNMPDFQEQGLRISCLQWDTEPTEAVKTLAPYDTWSFIDEGVGNQITYLTFSPRDSGSINGYGNATGRLGSLPAIKDQYLPIIKVATVSQGDIDNTATPKIEIFYLVPVANGNSGDTNVQLGDAGNGPNTNGNGGVYGVNCDSDGKCRAQISQHPNPSVANDARMFFFQVIGSRTADINYSRNGGGGGAKVGLKNIQTKVDVNVIAQDQSKRVVSYIASSGTVKTWQPWFAAVADSLCKDIKVDGTNSGGIINSVTACPNN
jgi:hypothetical protein